MKAKLDGRDLDPMYRMTVTEQVHVEGVVWRGGEGRGGEVGCLNDLFFWTVHACQKFVQCFSHHVLLVIYCK